MHAPVGIAPPAARGAAPAPSAAPIEVAILLRLHRAARIDSGVNKQIIAEHDIALQFGEKVEVRLWQLRPQRLGGGDPLADQARSSVTWITITGPAGRRVRYCSYLACNATSASSRPVPSSSRCATPRRRTHHRLAQSAA